MKASLLIIILCLFPLSTFAQSLECEDGVTRWETGFNAGLNNDGYELELKVMAFSAQYIGLKLGLSFASEIEELGDWGEDEFDTGHHYATRFKFNPAIVLRTPRLINWESQGGGFYLFTEPGIVLSPGASGSHEAKWFRWDLKSGINLQLDHYVFTLGYGISNFSLYSGEPHSHWGSPDDTDYVTHTVFVGCAYKF